VPKKLQINHAEVASATSRIRSDIAAEINEAESAYSQIDTALNNLDGGANASLIRAANLGRQKVQITGETLAKLAFFMDLSARQVDEVERNIISQLSQMNVPA